MDVAFYRMVLYMALYILCLRLRWSFINSFRIKVFLQTGHKQGLFSWRWTVEKCLLAFRNPEKLLPHRLHWPPPSGSLRTPPSGIWPSATGNGNTFVLVLHGLFLYNQGKYLKYFTWGFPARICIWEFKLILIQLNNYVRKKKPKMVFNPQGCATSYKMNFAQWMTKWPIIYAAYKDFFCKWWLCISILPWPAGTYNMPKL